MNWEEAVEESKQELGYYPNEYIEDWNEVVETAKDILYGWKEENWEEYEEEKKLNKEIYQEYLKSDKWKALRKLKLEKSRFICLDCKGKATEVHHDRYWNFGNPWEFYNLISLCRECHKKRHNIKIERKEIEDE